MQLIGKYLFLSLFIYGEGDSDLLDTPSLSMPPLENKINIIAIPDSTEVMPASILITTGYEVIITANGAFFLILLETCKTVCAIFAVVRDSITLVEYWPNLCPRSLLPYETYKLATNIAPSLPSTFHFFAYGIYNRDSFFFASSTSVDANTNLEPDVPLIPILTISS